MKKIAFGLAFLSTLAATHAASAIEVTQTMEAWKLASVDDRFDLARRMSVQAQTLKPKATATYLFDCINSVAAKPDQRNIRIVEIASACAITAE